MNRKPIQRAAVLGAGTMGAAISAHLANAGLDVLLLDVVPEGAGSDRTARDRLAREGLRRAESAKPAAFFTREIARRVRIGNFEDDLEAAGAADWVLEAVVEDLPIKHSLLRRTAAILGQDAILTTNTSGLPIGTIAQALPENVRRRFLGTHFFNPPRYLPLLELIPLPETDSDVLGSIEELGANRLGKTVVRAKDTPNFIANRLGSVAGAWVLDFALEHGYTVEEVDALTGPVMGRPKTATFRLLDWVGLDVASAVRAHLAAALPNDEAHASLMSPRASQLVEAMARQGWLGNKAGAGFYRRVEHDGAEEFWPLDLQTLEHRPAQKPRFDSLSRVREMPDLVDRLKGLLGADDRAGPLVRGLVYQGLAYASQRIPEIADTPALIDVAVRAGFGHEQGPFELWDLLGWESTAEAIQQEGFSAARWVGEMRRHGAGTFYRAANGGSPSVYFPSRGEYVAEPVDPMEISLPALRKVGALVEVNDGASLMDMGDDVLALEIRSKGSSLDADVLGLLDVALQRTEREFAGLILASHGEDFSLGANLFLIAAAAQNGMWDEIDRGIRALQALALRLETVARPVVVALAGRALGGGAELSMASARVVAAAESYIGLVEAAAGLIPAGGGCKEMLRRIVNPGLRTENALPLPFVQRVLETIGQARVGTSAEESRSLGYLGAADRLVMNRRQLLGEAKREVLHMAAGFRPRGEDRIYAGGRDVLAALRVGIFMAQEARALTEFEAKLGNKLAEVLTGGELSRGEWVSEGYILEREREAFLSLCGEEKAQQRMWHLLQHKRPLRN